ncbi:MAG: hypothetical protein MUF65_00930 [Rubritepida sp.]|nr:hypothetical protein [Rubritepida sp.]
MTRARLPALLAVTFVLAVCAVMLGLNIAYGRTAFSSVPFIDDWPFVELLRLHAERQIGLSHIFWTHNGHPSVFARVGFLLSARFDALDLSVIRWLAMTAVLATGIIVAVAMTLILTRQQDVPGFAQPGFVLAVPLAFAVCTTLGLWEIYTFAMGLGNASVTLFSLAAVFAFHGWLERREAAWLAVALACGLLAFVNMGQGVLVFPAMAGMAILHPERRRLKTVIAALLVAGAVGFLLLTLTGESTGGRVRTLTLGRALDMMLALLGVAVFGQVRNAVLAPVTMVFGGAVGLLLVYALLRSLRASEAQWRAMMPFFGCIALGVGAMVLLIATRHVESFDTSMSPRYVPIVSPIIVGLAGLLAVGASWGSRGAHALVALFALGAVGLVVTNIQEARMAGPRAAFQAEMMRNYRIGFEGLTDAEVNRITLGNHETVRTARSGNEFLRREGLSHFRTP